MKQKRFYFLSILIVVVLILSACAGASSSGDSTQNGEASDNEKYIISFSSSQSPGTARHEMVEKVLKDKLEQKSNGRLILEIYPNNTLASPNQMLDALRNGTVDAGYFIPNMFPGQFPYTELFGTPGLKFGGLEHGDKVIREYTEKFNEFNDFKVICRYTLGTMGLVTVKPVETLNQVKGMSVRATSNFMPFFENMGANCVSMSAADVYESIKLNVIDGVCTGINAISRNKWAEVTNSVTILNMLNGDENIVISKRLYDQLPADLQQVIDEVSKEMESILTEYTRFEEDKAIAEAIETNPDFKVIELSPEEEAKFLELAAPSLEKKAKELDAQGLKGSEALDWLRSQQVE